MTTFRMTCDRFHFLTPLLLLPVLVAQTVGLGWAAWRTNQTVLWVAFASMGLVFAILGASALMAPRAVRLTPAELRVERLLWPAFVVPLDEVTRVAPGPVARLVGDVRRLAGVGGWFWSGGLFFAKGVGRVRAWMTRLGPTVVVHRREGLPVLLGVDDPEGLLRALQARC